jgi:hypothetical protein
MAATTVWAVAGWLPGGAGVVVGGVPGGAEGGDWCWAG